MCAMNLPISAANAARLAQIAQASCGFITEVAWSPDGSLLAVAHGGGVRLWEDGFGGAPTRTLIGSAAPIKSIAFSPEGSMIATASSDATVRLWDAATGQPLDVLRSLLDVLRNHMDAVNAVAFSADGSQLASAGGDQRVLVTDLSMATTVVFEGHTGDITSVVFAQNMLASGGWDSEVRLWDYAARRERTVIVFDDWVRHLAASPDGSTLAAACKDGTLRLIDPIAGRVMRTIPAHERGVDAVAFSPDGALLVSGGRDNAVKLWDLRAASDTPLMTLTGHAKPVLTVAFHPRGSFIVSGGGDNTVRLWGWRNSAFGM